MVWSSTQSALYKAVNDYNSGFFGSEKTDQKFTEKKGEKFTENSSEKSCEKYAEKTSEKRGKIYGENTSGESCEKCPGYCGKNCEKNIRNSQINFQQKDPVSRIFSDRDMLLVAGLIFMLINEKADPKLILALAIVLLG